ncbi:hypothetical protein Q4Q35_05535 [Flavivirga aquimarina]|uniref:Uncharacterized protein n=1 Tax=Flavivirga aquimarina TaxID=2027862 RepID=A0ABT8W863_9FLAO|nr:hypothetical protein [Flavivirga aquimarina]MDO5969264.1 hypothetical protein [Flavivirga aquimarina]
MEKTEDLTFPDNLNIPNHYAIIATLFVLLDRSGLSHTVTTHCKMGLRAIAIIYDDPDFNSRTELLSAKEFNAFFSFFPAAFFNSRDLIPVDKLFDSVLLSLKSNKVIRITC